MGGCDGLWKNVAFSGSYDQADAGHGSRLAVKSGLYRTELALFGQMQLFLGEQAEQLEVLNEPYWWKHPDATVVATQSTGTDRGDRRCVDQYV